ncbi:sulfite reductase, alpha subunit (flavoprotein) [Terriglobus roseus DSM 18391]|uniref:assimilatory sulfite reductase (NADPH) n=1 Tax=Terriglobus roseus (strain DSM 18391 / NRRL B-41598 / KBS 63) TaxID=926566 RepID=I3ZE55_TERRK|nr:sulfite reductase subunit alpha [Terriglobus roseus]AFL87523.1 sulfite reductase, alpha subunit (flavoprotein) [Terriglobus roseus DSM 18391]
MSVPFLPDNAPFSTEQRAWLNGFLAGLFSAAPTAAAAVDPLQLAVYFASQSGTAERLAKKLVKELKAQGHVAELASLAKVTLADVAGKQHALFLVSTYGEGDPPESSISFRDSLFADGAPKLDAMRYAVFALGDRHYEQFCKFGADVDERLRALGATRLMARVDADVDVDVPFEQWKTALRPHLTQAQVPGVVASTAPVAVACAAESAPASPGHSRDNPFHAEMRERKPLTRDVSSKMTMHLSFGLADSDVHYQAGDACGVIAQNDPELVEEILTLLPFAADTKIEVAKSGVTTVRDALLHHLQPTRLTRKIVQHFAARTEAKPLTTLLLPEEASHLDSFMWDRGLVDLLHEYPGSVSEPAELVSMLPRLSPRLYSISSSPAAHGREVHCTIAVVRYRSHNRERGGIASTMLSDRVRVGERLPIYIQPNKKFRLPASDVPMIMIGPGTGIAPFRAFLHERQALGHGGRNWLFFGERSAQTDFLYCDELHGLRDSGYLTRLDTAFSRDQSHKIYVQDRMKENGAELWRWLCEGAQIYVCGDASRMAKDVDASLHEVIARHGGMNAEAAGDYVSQLHDDGRYHRDVY